MAVLHGDHGDQGERAEDGGVARFVELAVWWCPMGITGMGGVPWFVSHSSMVVFPADHGDGVERAEGVVVPWFVRHGDVPWESPGRW